MKPMMTFVTMMTLNLVVPSSFAVDNNPAYSYGNPGQRQALRVERMMSRLDLNQDGQITLDEAQSVHASLFKPADADGNGMLNLAEFQNVTSIMRGPQNPASAGNCRGKCRGNGTCRGNKTCRGNGKCRRNPGGGRGQNPSCPRLNTWNDVNGTPAQFARFDNNGDGQITLTEFTANMPLFDRFDADNNGIITRKELSQRPRPW